VSKTKIPANLRDADQILIWKAAVALMDQRTAWPRAMTAAIKMIEARDPALKYQYRDVRDFYNKRATRSKSPHERNGNRSSSENGK
jgi:hypothetical protein